MFGLGIAEMFPVDNVVPGQALDLTLTVAEMEFATMEKEEKKEQRKNAEIRDIVRGIFP